ncbi:hypothetical protein [Paraburkholderia sp. J7]|uniref:hypothetical protein n=1 Tax=Paraburkholderia sp. J7 TaxID=2805438 RepID=UPI002AB5F4F5|nr:hypothetical protein [Paraburkholderia sp. J7]
MGDHERMGISECAQVDCLMQFVFQDVSNRVEVRHDGLLEIGRGCHLEQRGADAILLNSKMWLQISTKNAGGLRPTGSDLQPLEHLKEQQHGNEDADPS